MPEITLVSTDIGTDLDDALAIVLLAQHPDRFDLRGIYTTAGPVELRARIAKKLLDCLGASSPVGVGESNPLNYSPSTIQSVTTGFEPILLTTKEQKHVSRSGVRILPDGLSHLEQQIAGAEEPVTLISLAPLTNIARLLQRFPSAPQHVRQLYILGGNTLPETPEHNFLNDVEAARIVFSSDFPITLIPANACQGYALPYHVFKYKKSIPGSPLKTYLERMANVWRLHNELAAFGDNTIRIMQFLHPGDKTKNFIEMVLDRREYIKDFRQAYYLYEQVFKYFLRTAEEPVQRLIKEAMELSEKKETIPYDAYVIYAILHPARVESRRALVTIAETYGDTILAPGDKHTVVTRFDYAHAGSFFEQHFRAQTKAV